MYRYDASGLYFTLAVARLQHPIEDAVRERLDALFGA